MTLSELWSAQMAQFGQSGPSVIKFAKKVPGKKSFYQQFFKFLPEEGTIKMSQNKYLYFIIRGLTPTSNRSNQINYINC